jgi:dTDP-4-amino-4,6-dideoxygalactose transaminase
MNKISSTPPLVEIPFADPASDLAGDFDQITKAVADVLKGGHYILGPRVAEFEAAMADRLGLPSTVGVASGTDALVIGLQSLGVGRGDEVVTVSHTAGPTVAAINMLGATPVLVDIEADTFCLDPHKLEAALSPKTKAIIAVHLYGHPADLTKICELANRRQIAVVEDCAQALGAAIRERPVGGIGDISCFSFYPTKNLGAIGDGGLVTARNSDLLLRVRQLREYGWTKRQYAELPGGRASRLDEIQAAILLIKLRSFDEAINKRRAIALRYNEAFRDLPVTVPIERKECRRVFHLYVIRSDRRDHLAAQLNQKRIATGLHYPYPAHAQPAFAKTSRVPEPLTVTDKVANEILTLPLFPSMTAAQQDRVIEAVRGYYGSK